MAKRKGHVIKWPFLKEEREEKLSTLLDHVRTFWFLNFFPALFPPRDNAFPLLKEKKKQ